MKGDMSPNCPACGANPHEECRMPIHDVQAINCARNPVALDSIRDDKRERSLLEALDEGKFSGGGMVIADPPYIKLKSTTSEAFDTAWLSIIKADPMASKKAKIISCLKGKGGAASLEECCEASDLPKDKCKEIINTMPNVKMSPHGDVVLTDGLTKMNPRLPKEGAIDGVLNVKPDPPAMHAGMPRDPDLLARLRRMYGDNPMKKPKGQEDFDPETAKYGINNLE